MDMTEDGSFTSQTVFEIAQNFYLKYVSKSIKEDMDEASVKKLKKYALVFGLTCQASLAPVSAFIGGVVSQEVIKAITQKYTPIT